jgi:hypothetical protein
VKLLYEPTAPTDLLRAGSGPLGDDAALTSGGPPFPASAQATSPLIEILPPDYGYSAADPRWTDSDKVDGAQFSRLHTRRADANYRMRLVPGEGLVCPTARHADFTNNTITAGFDLLRVDDDGASTPFRTAIKASLRMVVTATITMPDYTATSYTNDLSMIAAQCNTYATGKRWGFFVTQSGYLGFSFDQEPSDGFLCSTSPGFVDGTTYVVRADVVYNASNPGTLKATSVDFYKGTTVGNLAAVGTQVNAAGPEGGWGHEKGQITVGASSGGFYGLPTNQFKGTIHDITISDGTTDLIAVDYQNKTEGYTYEATPGLEPYCQSREIQDAWEMGGYDNTKQWWYTAADASVFDLPTVGHSSANAAAPRGVHAGFALDANNAQSLPVPVTTPQSFVWFGRCTRAGASGYLYLGPWDGSGAGFYIPVTSNNDAYVRFGVNGWGWIDPGSAINMNSTIADGDPHLVVLRTTSAGTDRLTLDVDGVEIYTNTYGSLVPQSPRTFVGSTNPVGELWTHFAGIYTDDVYDLPEWATFTDAVFELSGETIDARP